MRPFALLGLPLVLMACQAGPGAEPAQRNDGVAEKLTLGVTKPEVDTALGLDTGFERNPKNWRQSCASYVYGGEGQERYLHARFEDDVLVGATDRHGTLCTYG